MVEPVTRQSIRPATVVERVTRAMKTIVTATVCQHNLQMLI